MVEAGPPLLCPTPFLEKAELKLLENCDSASDAVLLLLDPKQSTRFRIEGVRMLWQSKLGPEGFVEFAKELERNPKAMADPVARFQRSISRIFVDWQSASSAFELGRMLEIAESTADPVLLIMAGEATDLIREVGTLRGIKGLHKQSLDLHRRALAQICHLRTDEERRVARLLRDHFKSTVHMHRKSQAAIDLQSKIEECAARAKSSTQGSL